MDILARIEEVIKQRGTNKAEVSEKMGKAKQNFKSLLTNPKWDSLELVCQAIGIEPWQLFEQEIMAAGYRLTAEPEPKDIENVAAAPNEGASKEEQAAAESAVAAADAPERQQAEAVRAVRFAYLCPVCGANMKVCISPE